MTSDKDAVFIRKIVISRTVRIIVPVLLTTLLFILTVFSIVIPTMRDSLLMEKRAKICELTQSVWCILANYEEKERVGQLSQKEAQEHAIEDISRIRYGPEMKDYFWINDIHCRMIFHPYRTDLIGKDMTDFTDPNGKRLIYEFVKTASAYGSGYVDYAWQKNDSSKKIVPKLSYVKLFKPWGWIVGTGVYFEDVNAGIGKITSRFIVTSGGILCIIFILSSYMIWNGIVREKERLKAEVSLREAHDALEVNVMERTAELTETNRRLKQEIEEHRLAEEQIIHNETRLRSLVRILQFRAGTIQEFLDNALEEAIKLTESRIGYLFFYHEEEKQLVLNTWSRNVMNECSIANPQTHYALDTTGIWGEAVRQRSPVLLNDFQAHHPLKKGYPEGHAHIARFMTVPVFREAGIVAVVGVANKPSDYEQSDVLQITLLMDAVWKSVDIMKSEEALRKSEALQRAIVTSSPVGLFTVDMETMVITWNESATRILGWSAEEVTGRPLPVIPDDKKDDADAYFQRVKNGEYLVDENFVCLTRNGSLIDISFSASRILDSDGAACAILGVVQDISDRKKAEEMRKELEFQRFQAQKLESIGQLASGIAHEINTPIQYIGDNIRFLLGAFNDLIKLLHIYMRVPEELQKGTPLDVLNRSLKASVKKADLEFLNDEIPAAIQQSIDGIARVREIVLAMKEFSHPDSLDKKAVNINQSVSSTAAIARNEWKYVAELVMDLDPSLPPVHCMPGELNQVILNMIVNAAHAIAAKTGSAPQQKGIITIKTCHDDRDAQIHISDTGTGIPESIRSRIFDPFFTTKEVGKGTGQGLAIAHAVIAGKHGGTIRVESEAGKGTTFIITLPIAG